MSLLIGVPCSCRETPPYKQLLYEDLVSLHGNYGKLMIISRCLKVSELHTESGKVYSFRLFYINDTFYIMVNLSDTVISHTVIFARKSNLQL